MVEAAADLPVDRIRSRFRKAYRREVLRNFVAESIIEALADVGLALDGDEEATARRPRFGQVRHEPGEMSHG